MSEVAPQVDDLNNQIIDGIESVRQRVVQRLRFRARSWFINLQKGVPYTPQVFGHQTTLPIATATITAAIKEVPDVTDVLDVDSTLDPDTRRMTYSATVHTIFGNFSMSEEVG